jgi:hypothetical protein
MKQISPVWFIKKPLDQEHKEYVLLDYLKKLSRKLDKENCYSILREISNKIKIINEFKESKIISEFLINNLKKEDKKIAKEFIYDNLDESDKLLLEKILESSLEILYEYLGICLDMIKEEESKIRIFKIDPPSGVENRQKSGIVIVRNMITDRIIPYYWQDSVTLKTKEGDKEIFILKKIHIKNQTFSLNYEYIYHEILEKFGKSSKRLSPDLHIIEIYENFEEDSGIYKLAKEKFIEMLS